MNQFKLIIKRRFAPLFFTQFLGAFNDNIYKNALVIFIAFSVADYTDKNSSVLVIIAAGLFILPFFLFSAIAGQLADKFEKSRLIQKIKIAEICIMLLATVGFLFLNIQILMLVLFLMGIQSTMFGPLKYGILPQHLEKSELTGGNGMIQMGTYLAILIGTMLGGILVAIKPYGVNLVSCCVITVAIAGWLASRNIPFAEPPAPDLKLNFNFIKETARIIGFARENKTVFWSIIAISWFWFIGATFLSMVPSYTRDVLGANEHTATMLLAVFSVGIGTGSLLCEKLSGDQINMGLVPLGALGLSIFPVDLFTIGIPQGIDQFGSSPVLLSELLGLTDFWHVLLDLICIGIFGGLYIVPLYALVQYRSEVRHRARIIAANNILNALFMVLSALITIFLISMHITIPTIFLMVAVLNVFMVSLVFWQVPEFINHLLKWAKFN